MNLSKEYTIDLKMETKKIIIADVNPESRKWIKLDLDSIKDKELKIDEISTGNDLVEKVSTENYDLGVIAYKLPELDGIEATKKIRETDKNIPIIMVSGLYEFVKERAKKAGITDGISKPYDLKELADLVNKYL